jgi:prepilin-type N-terminal cleavage/methylation domain-containing protein
MSLKRNGFTLLELSIVLLVITVLAAIAWPVYSGIRERAQIAAMQSDLRNLATAQEVYFSDRQAYAFAASQLDDSMRESPDVSVFIDSGTATGWGGTATHAGTLVSCRIANSRSGYQSPVCDDQVKLKILQPRPGALIRGDEVVVSLGAAGIELAREGGGNGAHHHLFLDRDPSRSGEVIPEGVSDVIHLGPGQSEFRIRGLASGDHQIIAALADESHVPLAGAPVDTVRFSVRRGS